MNEKNAIQPIDETASLPSVLFNEVLQKISDNETDAENISKEKYAVKAKLIESANDMSTQEKLDAMDKNYDRRNQESWQNILCSAIASVSVVGIVIVFSVAIKNIR